MVIVLLLLDRAGKQELRNERQRDCWVQPLVTLVHVLACLRGWKIQFPSLQQNKNK